MAQRRRLRLVLGCGCVRPACPHPPNGCGATAHSRELCRACYGRAYRAGELAVRPQGARPVRPCRLWHCAAPATCDGLCSGHYQQQYLGRPLLPLRPSQRPGGATREETLAWCRLVLAAADHHDATAEGRR
jgi:hypothetical protein